jgi:CMP-N-acetylneuraminic acid synthetase
MKRYVVKAQPTIYAMIPARIGSTRFKMKNLAMLNGKPMIAYAIEAALASKAFDRVIVNADSDVFRSIAEEYGAEFYLRPEHLGGSSVKSDDVVQDFINKYPSDVVVWENPIAPLQTVEDIQDTIKYFLSNNLDSLFTVKEEQIQCVYENKPINYIEQDKFAQTQDLTPVCPFVPFIMMWKTRTFIEEYDKTGYAFFSGKVGYFPVSRLSSIIIKYEEDFRMAEMLIESKKKELTKIEYFQSGNTKNSEL